MKRNNYSVFRMIILFIILFLKFNLFAQPANEINTFRNFKVDGVRNEVNDYLLSLLSYLVYADQLAKYVPVSAEDLNKNPAVFAKHFEDKTKHFFYNKSTLTKAPTNTPVRRTQTTALVSTDPKFEFVNTTDRRGIDPEVMLITTNDAVYVVVRGTDRVGGANSTFNYKWGEWIQTNGLAFLVPPCSSCSADGAIHRGFHDALHYGDSITYIKALTDKIANAASSNKKVWITGHSLGGAMAQLIGYYLYKYKGLKARGITVFASPHPGNPGFANTLNNIFSNQQVQRFEFIDDPVTKLPGRYMTYGRAGHRNHIVKATGPGHIIYNAGEREGSDAGAIALLVSSGLSGYGGACFHHPEWYVNACYNALSNSLKTQVPTPPALPNTASEACKSFDINLGTSGNYIDPGSAVITAGTYTLKNASSGKYLIASKSDCPLNINNCCPVFQNSTSVISDDNKWIIEKVQGAVLTSYTIKNKKHNTVLDADAICANSNNCKIQNCNRLLIGDRRMQEWSFVQLSNGNYALRCVAGDKYLRVNPDCISKNECALLLYQFVSEADQEFILTKVN